MEQPSQRIQAWHALDVSSLEESLNAKAGGLSGYPSREESEHEWLTSHEYTLDSIKEATAKNPVDYIVLRVREESQ